MIRIGIDISSGEKSPHDLFLSLKEYSQENPSDSLVVYIDQEILDSFPSLFVSSSNIKIVPALEKITMEENPVKGVKRKKKSSIVLGLSHLKEKKIDLFFSPGNSGAVVYGAVEILGLVKSIQLPAIATFIPNIYGNVILLDAGANAFIDEDQGAELALMGKVLYQQFFKEPHPKIGILNVGKEWYKGPKWTRKLNNLLKKDVNCNYFGFVEGFDIFTSACQVFITGGYTGNILLKGLEGVYDYVKFLLKDKGQWVEENLKNQIHYSRVGAAVVLGTHGNVFLGHGITSPDALKNALAFSKNVYKLNISSYIEEEIRGRGFLSRLGNRRNEK